MQIQREILVVIIPNYSLLSMDSPHIRIKAASSMTPLSAVYLLIILATCICGSIQQSGCPIGTYVNSKTDGNFAYCAECPPETFMPQKDHKHTECFNCTEIEDPTLEILISHCNKTTNTDIQCVDGYYRVIATSQRTKSVCKKCDPCHELLHQVRRCQNYSNTFCCPDVNWDYVYNQDGSLKCRERPWMCRKGQYMDTSLNDCKPCPDGTFMSVDYHSYTECWNCQYHSDADLPLHTELIQQCNSTLPAIYSCRDGYYINHSLSYRGDDIGCLPCTSCSDEMFVGRQCDKFKDTVCCGYSNMTVVDDLGGVRCHEDENSTESTFEDAWELPGEKGLALNKSKEIELNVTDFKDSAKCQNESGCWPLWVVLVAESLIIIAFVAYVVWTKIECIRCKRTQDWKKPSASAERLIEPLRTVIDFHESTAYYKVEQNEDAKQLEGNSLRTVYIALVGKTGSGKSSTGNTILGKMAYDCGDSTSSVTRDTMLCHSEFNDTGFTVADIPCIGEECDDINKVKDSLVSFFRKNPTGIRVVLYIFRYGGRVTKDDTKMLEMIGNTFGDDFIKRHVIVAITFGDIFERSKRKEKLREWCAQQDGPFASLVKECEERVMLFDNTVSKRKRRGCMEELFRLINKVAGHRKKPGVSETSRLLDAANEDQDGDVTRPAIEETAFA